MPNANISKCINPKVSNSAFPNNAWDFYKQLYKGKNLLNNIASDKKIKFTIKEEEIKDIIEKLDPNKAVGPSGISVLFLQTFIDQVSILLSLEYNKFFEHSIDPRWKRGFIKLIPKKGDLNDVDNWRPISLLNVEWKIFSRILLKNLEEICSNQQGAWQIGFKKGR